MKKGVGKTLPGEVSRFKAVNRLLLYQITAIRKNLEPAARNAGPDPLHDIRVAVRHLRFLLKFFRKVLFIPGVKKLDTRLCTFTKSLSEARDRDVWLIRLRRFVNLKEFRRQKSWQVYQNAQIQMREKLQSAVARTLRSKKVLLLLDEIETQLSLPKAGSNKGSKPAISINALLKQSLDGLPMRLKRRNGLLRGGRTDAMHSLRKYYRKERYLAEAAVALKNKKSQALVKKIKAVTKDLGELHDLDMALEFVKTDKASPPSELPNLLLSRRRRQLAVSVKAVRGFIP